MNKNMSPGFTLIELVIALSIVFIVTTLAIPNFRETMQRNKTVSATNQIVRTLNLARSEAIKRGIPVTVRPSRTNWKDGWDVFADHGGDGLFEDNRDFNFCQDGEDCLIRSFEGPDGNMTVRASSNYGSWLTYRASGTSQGSGGLTRGSFRVCRTDGETNTSPLIDINNTGRVNLREPSNELCS